MSFNQPFRAVVCDLDGTLLNAQGKVAAFTAQTLARLEQLGIDIILATGRNYHNVLEFLHAFNSQRGVMITSNGSRIYDGHAKLCYRNNLPEDIALELMNLIDGPTEIIVNSYQEDKWLVNFDIKDYPQYYRNTPHFMYQVTDFKQHHGRDTEKVFYIAKSNEQISHIRQMIEQRFSDQVSITHSNPLCLEIMNRGVSKASALQELLAERDYSLSDCIAFGDSMNDQEILGIVGRGCIMANADPKLCQVLPHLMQIGHHKDEAVASYLRALFTIV